LHPWVNAAKDEKDRVEELRGGARISHVTSFRVETEVVEAQLGMI